MKKKEYKIRTILVIIVFLNICTFIPITNCIKVETSHYNQKTIYSTSKQTYDIDSKQDNWYNNNWEYRKQLNITNPKNNYPLELNISYDTILDGGEDVSCEEHCNINFSDLRFTEQDAITLRNYYLKEKVDGDYALVLINTSGDNHMYMYYGNNEANHNSNPDGVYLFFDDFEDGIINTTRWEYGTEGDGANVTEENGTLNLSTTYGQHGGSWIRSNSSYRTFKNNISIEKLAYYYDEDYKWFCLGTYDSVICDGTGDTTPPFNYSSFLRLNNSYEWYHLRCGTNEHRIAKITNSTTTFIHSSTWCGFSNQWNNITYNYLYNGTIKWIDENTDTIGDISDTSYRDNEKDIFISQGGYDVTRAGFINIEYIKIKRYCPDDEPAWNSFGNEEKYNHPPYTPYDPFPQNNSIEVNIDIDLSWTGGDPDGDNVTYDVYFNNTSPPTIVNNNQSNTTYDPGTLDFDETYYWQIVAWDNHSLSTKGPIWCFTTGKNKPPLKPIILSGPSFGKPEVSLEFSAKTTDPEGDEIYYQWYWGDGTYSDWLGPYLSGDTIITNHKWKYAGVFKVRIKGKDQYGAESQWSDPKNLTIDDDPPKLKIKKPSIGGIYLFNCRIFPFYKPVIIGSIDIIAEASDSQSGMDHVEIYIDNNLTKSFNSTPYIWRWYARVLFPTKIEIKILGYDNVGNVATTSIDIFKIF